MGSSPGFLQGAAAPFRGASALLSRPGLLKYALGAWAAALALFAALAAAFFLLLPGFADRLSPRGAPAWTVPALGCLLALAAAVLALFLFTIAGNLVAGPFLDAMTERLLSGLGEKLPPPAGFWKSAGRALAGQAQKLALFGALQAGVLLLWFTPLGFLHPAASALLMAVFLALEYLDYPLGARGLSVPRRFRYVLRHARPCLGFGSAAFLLLLAPGAALLLLPALACGAALLAHDIDGSSSKL